eukprot:2200077-Heterocapsa_arctica.AAC.1
MAKVPATPVEDNASSLVNFGGFNYFMAIERTAVKMFKYAGNCGCSRSTCESNYVGIVNVWSAPRSGE